MSAMDEENGHCTAVVTDTVFERTDNLLGLEVIDVKADSEIRGCEVAGIRGKAAGNTTREAMDEGAFEEMENGTYMAPFVSMTLTTVQCSVS